MNRYCFFFLNIGNEVPLLLERAAASHCLPGAIDGAANVCKWYFLASVQVSVQTASAVL